MVKISTPCQALILLPQAAQQYFERGLALPLFCYWSNNRDTAQNVFQTYFFLWNLCEGTIKSPSTTRDEQGLKYIPILAQIHTGSFIWTA